MLEVGLFCGMAQEAYFGNSVSRHPNWPYQTSAGSLFSSLQDPDKYWDGLTGWDGHNPIEEWQDEKAVGGGGEEEYPIQQPLSLLLPPENVALKSI